MKRLYDNAQGDSSNIIQYLNSIYGMETKYKDILFYSLLTFPSKNMSKIGWSTKLDVLKYLSLIESYEFFS